MGVITFNGVASTAYGIQVESPPGYQMPAKDVGVVHIPGRSGDLIIDRGSYQNATRSYNIAISRYSVSDDCKDGDFSVLTHRIAAWLNTKNYARLEDTYDPDFYRQAICIDALDVENIFNKAGRATITFDCKPQRFLKTGSTTVSHDIGSVFARHWVFTINNPYNFDSLPKIKFRRDDTSLAESYDATITCNGYVNQNIVITSGGFAGARNSTVTIDSATMDCYSTDSISGGNRNPFVIFNTGFPVLHPGINTIRVFEKIEKVEVTPNWWTL